MLAKGVGAGQHPVAHGQRLALVAQRLLQFGRDARAACALVGAQQLDAVALHFDDAHRVGVGGPVKAGQMGTETVVETQGLQQGQVLWLRCFEHE